MKAMIRAAMSDNMWKESATRAIELVRWPTTISTRKKLDVRKNIDTSRHFLPEYRPILSVNLCLWVEKRAALHYNKTLDCSCPFLSKVFWQIFCFDVHGSIEEDVDNFSKCIISTFVQVAADATTATAMLRF